MIFFSKIWVTKVIVSSLPKREGFSAVSKHKPLPRHIVSMRWGELCEILLPNLQWSIRQFSAWKQGGQVFLNGVWGR